MHNNNRRPAVPLEALDPTLTDVSRRVIGFAIEVHKTLGPGFTKEVYGSALAVELDEASIEHKREAKVPVTYRDKRVGELTLDLIVNDRFERALDDLLCVVRGTEPERTVARRPGLAMQVAELTEGSGA